MVAYYSHVFASGGIRMDHVSLRIAFQLGDLFKVCIPWLSPETFISIFS